MRTLLLALVLVTGLSACGDDGAQPTASPTPTPTPCTGLTTPSPGAPAALPMGLPLTAGSTVLRVETQGRTTIAYASLPGDEDDLVAVRDKVLADLKAKGINASGLDAEAGFEAEAELSGAHRGTLKVTPLCDDVLQIRYKLNG